MYFIQIYEEKCRSGKGLKKKPEMVYDAGEAGMCSGGQKAAAGWRRKRKMKELKLALLGFGIAGNAFSRILLAKHDEIAKDTGYDVKVTAITTGRSGCLIDPAGIDLAAALQEMEENRCFRPEFPGYAETDSMTVVREADYDAVLEMTPINIKTGQPAIDHLRLAMERGKHAITANKGPIAWAYRELRDLAREKGVCFFYETTVMAGTPIFDMAETSLAYCKISHIRGILNATTNYFLEEMGKGLPFDTIMENGRKGGFLEADPSMDLDGWDASAKLTALMNVLMDADLDPMKIDRTGIMGVTTEQVLDALGRGKKIKLLCEGYFDEEGKAVGVVKPTEIPADDAMAGSDVVAAVRLDTDLMGPVTITQYGLETTQTGYGLFIDVVRTVRSLVGQGW